MVEIEATGNSAAVEGLLRPFVKKVAIANPPLVRAIAFARVKTDKIDAGILARLCASGFLPEVKKMNLTHRTDLDCASGRL